MSEVDRGRNPRGPGRRPPLDGVVLVSVGSGRDRVEIRGARQAHVARINDLPSLIRALAEGSPPRT